MEIVEKRYFDYCDGNFELQFFIKNEELVIDGKSFHLFDEDWKIQRFVDVNLPPYTHTNVDSVIYFPNTNEFVIRCFTNLQIDEFDDERQRFIDSDFKKTDKDVGYHEKDKSFDPLVAPEYPESDISRQIFEEGNFIIASIRIKSDDGRLIESYFTSLNTGAEYYFNPYSPFKVKRLHSISYDTQNKSFIYTAKFPKRKMKSFQKAGFVLTD